MLIKKLVRSAVVATAAMIGIGLISSDASAQCYGGGGGYGGYGGYGGRGLSISIGSGYGSGFGLSYGGGSRYRTRRPAYFHDTSHIDYYPGRYVRHRDHLDYVPGHYGVHRTGHWHH